MQARERLDQTRRERFADGVANVFAGHPGYGPELDRDGEVDGVLLAFMVAYHERRALSAGEALGEVQPVMSGRLRNRLVALRVLVNREALRATRRLGGSWEAVYDLLAAEQARVEAVLRPLPVPPARA